MIDLYTEKTIDLFIREPEPGDQNFINNSWLKSFEKPMAAVPKELYRKGQMKLMARLMEESTCYIACSPEELTQIYGWMVFGKIGDIGMLHYIYVKHPYRRFGIGGKLFSMLICDKSVPVIATHATMYLDHIKDKWNLTYNPYMLLENVYE